MGFGGFQLFIVRYKVSMARELLNLEGMFLAVIIYAFWFIFYCCGQSGIPIPAAAPPRSPMSGFETSSSGGLPAACIWNTVSYGV